MGVAVKDEATRFSAKRICLMVAGHEGWRWIQIGVEMEGERRDCSINLDCGEQEKNP